MKEREDYRDRGIESQKKTKTRKNTKKNLREFRDMINESLEDKYAWDDLMEEEDYYE